MGLRKFTRRQFLQRTWWIPLFLGGVAAVWQYLSFFRPDLADEASSRRRIGRPEDFPIGRKLLLADTLAYVIRDEQGFWAISARCTHLGCAMNTMDWGFVCPCHGSKFDPRGQVLAGPAGTALPWFKLSLAPDGTLVLDVRRQVAPGTVLKV
jgi:cytochrome b6-f complex iron-sulfur subunit